MVSDKSVKHFYDFEAEIYDKKRFADLLGKYTDEKQKAIIKKMLEHPPPTIILEIGCGTGRFTTMLAKTGFMVLATDISTSMIRITKMKILKLLKSEQKKLDIEYLVCDANFLPFREEICDYVVSVNVINHIPEWNKTVREVNRVLKKNKFFIVNFPLIHSICLPFAVTVNLRKKSLLGEVYSKWFSLKEVIRVLTKNYFSICDMIGLFIPPFPFSRLQLKQSMIKVLDTINKYTFSTPLKFFATNLFVKCRKDLLR